jgi:hypothetical protein
MTCTLEKTRGVALIAIRLTSLRVPRPSPHSAGGLADHVKESLNVS